MVLYKNTPTTGRLQKNSTALSFLGALMVSSWTHGTCGCIGHAVSPTGTDSYPITWASELPRLG